MDLIKSRLKIKKSINQELEEVKRILRSREPEEVKIDSIKAIFEELASEIVQAQMEKLYDDRTGFLGPKFGEEFLSREIDFAERYKRKFAIALVDIDFLKYINDKFGHVSGTKIILEVAKAIKLSIRKTDVASRYGGDEFLIIFTASDLAKTEKALERLKHQVDEITVAKKIRTSLSVGVAEYVPGKRCSASDLIARADKNLYEAKKKRKNVNI